MSRSHDRTYDQQMERIFHTYQEENHFLLEEISSYRSPYPIEGHTHVVTYETIIKEAKKKVFNNTILYKC